MDMQHTWEWQTKMELRALLMKEAETILAGGTVLARIPRQNITGDTAGTFISRFTRADGRVSPQRHNASAQTYNNPFAILISDDETDSDSESEEDEPFDGLGIYPNMAP